MEELSEAVFSTRSLPRAYKVISEQSGSREMSPACKDVSPGAEERPPLEAVTEQRA
jgi:hypothetical protein